VITEASKSNLVDLGLNIGHLMAVIFLRTNWPKLLWETHGMHH